MTSGNMICVHTIRTQLRSFLIYLLFLYLLKLLALKEYSIESNKNKKIPDSEMYPKTITVLLPSIDKALCL